MTKLLALSLLFLLFFSCVDPESNHPLEGLIKMTNEELTGQSITLKPTIPSYTEAGIKIDKSEWGNYISNKQFDRDLYKDQKGEVRAVVFKKKPLGRNDKPALNAAETKLVGKPAPAFTAMNRSGQKISLAELRGKVVVLNFWFTSCKPCILEMPDLNSLQADFKEEVVFLGITFNSNKEVATFLQQTKFNYDILPDAAAICKQWKVNAFPTNVVIDKKGMVVFFNVGYDKEIKKTLKETIQTALQ